MERTDNHDFAFDRFGRDGLQPAPGNPISSLPAPATPHQQTEGAGTVVF